MLWLYRNWKVAEYLEWRLGRLSRVLALMREVQEVVAMCQTDFWPACDLKSTTSIVWQVEKVLLIQLSRPLVQAIFRDVSSKIWKACVPTMMGLWGTAAMGEPNNYIVYADLFAW